VCLNNDWSVHTWYQNTGDAMKYNVNAGLIDLNRVLLPVEEGHFYLCGPVAFMAFVKSQLVQKGVKEAHIHYEVFGPHDELAMQA
jgi:nitric oxide dioxygenase